MSFLEDFILCTGRVLSELLSSLIEFFPQVKPLGTYCHPLRKWGTNKYLLGHQQLKNHLEIA